MIARSVFVAAFALLLYGNGAAFVESFVNYPSWPLIGEDEFLEYHRFITPRVVTFLVVPTLGAFVCSLLMLRFRPLCIPLWSVWTALGLQAVVWISTATIQVPIQLELGEHGLSLPLVERLIETNWWLRRIPLAAAAALFVWMAFRAMSGPERRAQ